MKNSAKSKNLKKFVAILEFLTATIADMLVPGSGIVLDALFLLLELMEKDEIEGKDSQKESGRN